MMEWNLREARTIQNSWGCLGMKAVKMSLCLTSCPTLGCSFHCHQMFVAAHILLWSRMSLSSLVHHPVSNELPGSENVAGRPCKAFHHSKAWQGHSRTAGDDGPSGSSLMATGRYLQNSQNPAVGRHPGLLLPAVDYWSFHLGCFHLIFQGCICSFITLRYPVS